MKTMSHQLVFKVSEPYFRLATEAIRVRSNETRRFESLGRLVCERALTNTCLDHDSKVVRDHLAVVSTHGDIRLALRVNDAGANGLASVANRLGNSLDLPLGQADALSVLLFDYIVERKSKQALGHLVDQQFAMPGNAPGIRSITQRLV